jgi:hypothetical protein
VLLDFDAAWIYAPIAVLLLVPAVIELKPCSSASRAARRRRPFSERLSSSGSRRPRARYSEDRKQRLTLEYSWDEAARTARWLVYHDGAALPEAMAAAATFERGVKVAWSDYRRWSAPASGGPALARPRSSASARGRRPRAGW